MFVRLAGVVVGAWVVACGGRPAPSRPAEALAQKAEGSSPSSSRSSRPLDPAEPPSLRRGVPPRPFDSPGAIIPSPPAAEPWPVFADVGYAAGVVAPHVPDLLHSSIGQAWGDFDGDGWLDLYTSGGMAASRLFHNEGDGTFSELDAGAAALVSESTGGAAWGDFDNDGYDDLVVVTAGVNRLFHNLDGVVLEDVTFGSGLVGQDQSMMAAWGDYDADGCLDLYIANHGLDPDQLYRGGCNGMFADVTYRLPGADSFSPAFAATFTDVDHDGDVDLYVVNDHHFGNDLFLNGGAGRFSAPGARTGANIEIDGMGLAVGDYDNDLDLDFYMSDIYATHLLRSTTRQGGLGYEVATAEAGVDCSAISWGTDFLDFDNDGWLDLYLATSSTDPALSNRLYRNLGDGTFEDVSVLSGADDGGWSYGAVVADYDEDGFVDLVVGNRGDGYHLYRNLGTVGADHHFITLHLVGDGPVNRNALGARAWVGDSNGVTRMAEVRSGSTMGGGSSMRLHFGLGTATVERVTVRWPDGTVSEYGKLHTDTLHSLVYGR